MWSRTLLAGLLAFSLLGAGLGIAWYVSDAPGARLRVSPTKFEMDNVAPGQEYSVCLAVENPTGRPVRLVGAFNC